MTRREMTLVYYYVPQDKDDPESPNVFGVPKAKHDLKLSHISQTFPLKGSYLFRFKIVHDGIPVWLDLPDIDSKIPLFKDRIIMKATRISWSQSKLHSHYRQKVTQAVDEQLKVKSQKIDFFEQKKRHEKFESNYQNNSNGIDLITHSSVKESPSPVNLLEEGAKEGSINSGWPKKKEQVNLLNNFQHNSDLLS